MSTHEDTSVEDSGLPKKDKRNEGEINNWKEVWINEIDKKVRTREIHIKVNVEKYIVTQLMNFNGVHIRACKR